MTFLSCFSVENQDSFTIPSFFGTSSIWSTLMSDDNLGEYGMPKKWYFFVTKSYWCGTKIEHDPRDYTPESPMELDQNQHSKDTKH